MRWRPRRRRGMMLEFDIASPSTPRWIQRFQNFDRALLLLRTAVEILDERGDEFDAEMLAIIREGAIQRFEYCFELAWKTLMDYLRWRKVTLAKSGGGDVLKAAFEAGYITNGDVWMDALDARNEMSHVYRQESFERVLRDAPCSVLVVKLPRGAGRSEIPDDALVVGN